MKDRIDPEEVLQAAKYCPYLEIMFGRKTRPCEGGPPRNENLMHW